MNSLISRLQRPGYDLQKEQAIQAAIVMLRQCNAQSKPDCGEAGHDEGRCGNVQCLPGAAAPSAPTALLVAAADLVAQMEIVSRVGFVDTPNDKDSCAAFCMAEGTWLELMSAVESLASALAAAVPEDER